jgi:hypothetical protein
MNERIVAESVRLSTIALSHSSDPRYTRFAHSQLKEVEMSRESKRRERPTKKSKPIKQVKDSSATISPGPKDTDKQRIPKHNAYTTRVRERAKKAVGALPDADRAGQEKAVRDEARRARDTYKEELGAEPENVHVEVTGENENGGDETIVVDVPPADEDTDPKNS